MTTLCLDNHPQSFWQLIAGFSVSWLHWANESIRSELAAADQCLKFCDVTPSAATLTTLNNPWDLDLDCSAASFLVQWTQAHWNAGKQQCGVNSVQVLRPAKTRCHCLRCSELLAVNLVWVRSHSNKDFILAPGCTNTRSCLTKFWNSNSRITINCQKP